MILQTEDGSIEDSSGKVIFFSIERFVRDIAEGNCCFICGISPDKSAFNNEHVLPEWILRSYGLFSRMVALPNGTTFRYDQYTVPCCCECNNHMSRVFETPLSSLITQGFKAISEQLRTNPGLSWLVFTWLALIFIKTHLKDKTLRLHRDTRQPDNKIADFYTWETLHHIHCVARSFYTMCPMDPKVHGSLLVLPAQTQDHYEHFDYGDLYFAKTVLLRLGDAAFITVLNDSCAAWNVCQATLERITGALSTLQLRELTAHFAFVNLNLKDRPTYYSGTDATGVLRMSASLPDHVNFEDPLNVTLGTVVYGLCKEIISTLKNADEDNLHDHVKQGRYTFLFDSEGRFIQNSMYVQQKQT